jgi:hypothetical protein
MKNLNPICNIIFHNFQEKNLIMMKKLKERKKKIRIDILFDYKFDLDYLIFSKFL